MTISGEVVDLAVRRPRGERCVACDPSHVARIDLDQRHAAVLPHGDRVPAGGVDERCGLLGMPGVAIAHGDAGAPGGERRGGGPPDPRDRHR